jgi:hypothetical protein
MSQRYWPKDPLGNDIRKGSMVAFASGQPTVMRVVEVVEAGLMPQEEGKPPIIKEGYITLLMRLPYQPHQTLIPIAVVVKEPDESKQVHLA